MPAISKAVKPRRKCRFNVFTGKYDELYRFELHPPWFYPQHKPNWSWTWP